MTLRIFYNKIESQKERAYNIMRKNKIRTLLGIMVLVIIAISDMPSYQEKPCNDRCFDIQIQLNKELKELDVGKLD